MAGVLRNRRCHYDDVDDVDDDDDGDGVGDDGEDGDDNDDGGDGDGDGGDGDVDDGDHGHDGDEPQVRAASPAHQAVFGAENAEASRAPRDLHRHFLQQRNPPIRRVHAAPQLVFVMLHSDF